MQIQVVVNTATTNPIQDTQLTRVFLELFSVGGPFWSNPFTRHIYPTVIKLGTVIPYLEKIQKIYK